MLTNMAGLGELGPRDGWADDVRAVSLFFLFRWLHTDGMHSDANLKGGRLADRGW